MVWFLFYNGWLCNIDMTLLTSVQDKRGSFCINSATFRDLGVGGVLVKTCIFAFFGLPFLIKANPSQY